MKKAASNTITLKPETYRRLAELADLGGTDVSDEADAIITTFLDEQDELDELQGNLCPVCNQPDCPGGCFEKFVLDAGLVEP
jgi:hypothetical protein